MNQCLNFALGDSLARIGTDPNSTILQWMCAHKQNNKLKRALNFQWNKLMSDIQIRTMRIIILFVELTGAYIYCWSLNRDRERKRCVPLRQNRRIKRMVATMQSKWNHFTFPWSNGDGRVLLRSIESDTNEMLCAVSIQWQFEIRVFSLFGLDRI